MTYLALLLLGLLPPIGLLVRCAGTRNSLLVAGGRHQLVALAGLVVLAVLATLPWDAAMIARGTWSYPRAQPVGWVAGVPVEELLFMVLQPLLVGLWLRTRPDRSPAPRLGCARAVGAAAWLSVAALGVLLARSPSGSYLGLLLAWACPLLALQWAVAGDALWAQRRLLTTAALPPTLYLWALDRLGLHLHLWQLSGTRTTGLQILGLPVEEALFFALTTLLVVGGLLLATDPQTLSRLRSWLPRRTPPAAPPNLGPAAPGGARTMMSLREVDGTVWVVDDVDDDDDDDDVAGGGGGGAFRVRCQGTGWSPPYRCAQTLTEREREAAVLAVLRHGSGTGPGAHPAARERPAADLLGPVLLGPASADVARPPRMRPPARTGTVPTAACASRPAATAAGPAAAPGAWSRADGSAGADPRCRELA